MVQDRQDTSQIKVYQYHNNHLGTPQELTNELGEVVWANYEYAWGGRYTHHYTTQTLNGCVIIETDLQPVRFQGQYYDNETGLHYNRFRYYDSDVGMFIQRDPIGLLGGFNVFAYADNPIQFIDPLGLTKRIYEKAPYYGSLDNAIKNKAPENGQVALDNSVQVKETSPRRVGVDKVANELVVLDRTEVRANGDEIFHGHVRSWDESHIDQKMP